MLEFGQREGILAAIALSWFYVLGVRLSFPVLLPHISAEFELNLVVAGILMSALFGGYAIGQVPGGILVDRFGERDVLVWSMSLFLSGVLFVSVLQSFWGLVGGILLLSLASGIFAPARFTILSDVYSDREGTAHGVAMAAGDVGNTVLPVVAGVLSVTFYWRLGIAYALPFLFTLVVVLSRVIPERTSGGTKKTPPLIGIFQTIRRELSRKIVLFAVFLLLAQSILFQGYTGLYPTYLIAEKGLDETTASLMLGVFFGTAVVVHLLAGMGADRFGTKPVMGVLLTVGVCALWSIPFVGDVPTIALVTALSSAPMGVITITLPYLIGVLSDDVRGTGFGIIRTGYLLTASLSPFAVGVLGNYGHFDAAFLLLGGVTATALVVSRLLPKET